MECQWEKDVIPCDVFILLPPYRQTQLIVHDVHLHALHYLSHPWPSEVLPSCQWMQPIRTLIAFCLSTARYSLPLKMENVQKYLYVFSFGRSLNFCNGRQWENQNMLNKSPSLEMLPWQQHFLMPVKQACAFKTSYMCHDFLTKVFPWLLWFYVTVWIFSDVEQWIWMCCCVCPPNLICAVEVKKSSVILQKQWCYLVCGVVSFDNLAWFWEMVKNSKKITNYAKPMQHRPQKEMSKEKTNKKPNIILCALKMYTTISTLLPIQKLSSQAYSFSSNSEKSIFLFLEFCCWPFYRMV